MFTTSQVVVNEKKHSLSVLLLSVFCEELKDLKQTVDEAKSFKTTRKLLEQGGYRGFSKTQIVMARSKQKENMVKGTSVGFRIFQSDPWY